MIHVIGKYVCHLPPGHVLPEYQAKDELYDKGHIPLIREILKSEKGWIVDIGANIGDSACMFASLGTNPILCIEGHEMLFPYLRRNIEQIDNKVIIKESFIFNEVIHNFNLQYLPGMSSGQFDVTQDTEPHDRLNFITMDDIEKETNSSLFKSGGISIFKTDTDGMDIFIVQDFIKQDMSKDVIINMEFSPNYQIIDNDQIYTFLKSLEKKQYALALFDNRGAPISFQNDLNPDFIIDMLNYTQFSSANSISPFPYFDFWLFPKSKFEIFKNIATGYRQRKFM